MAVRQDRIGEATDAGEVSAAALLVRHGDVAVLGGVEHDEPGGAYVISVTIESTSKEPYPVLTVETMPDSSTVALLSWRDCDKLARLLADAQRRPGS